MIKRNCLKKQFLRAVLGGMIVLFGTSKMIFAENAKPGDTNRSYHRLNLISVGAGLGYSAELLAYEYINQNRWGFRYSLLNGNFGEKDVIRTNTRTSGSFTYSTTGETTDGTAAWIPFSVRRYYKQSSSWYWPFLGVGLAFIDSWKGNTLEEDEESRLILPSLEAGYDFGGQTTRGFISFRTVPAPHYIIATVNVGVSVGW